MKRVLVEAQGIHQTLVSKAETIMTASCMWMQMENEKMNKQQTNEWKK